MTGATKIRIGFGAGLALFFGIGIAIVIRTLAWQEDARWVAHTNEVIQKIARLALSANIAESSARLYVFTSDPASLENARSSARDAIRAGSDLGQLTSDNPVQRPNVRLLRPLLAQESLVLSQDSSASAPELRQALAGMAAAGLSGSIAGSLAAMDTEERRLLVERTGRQQEKIRTSRFVLILGGLFSFSLIVIAGWRMSADFTIRSLAEQKFAIRDEQYRQVVELAGDIIYRTDEQGRFTFCNQAALAMLHFTEVEVLGRSYLKLVRQDRRRAAERFYMRQFARKQKSTYYEFPILDGHGHERWIGQNVQMVFDGAGPMGFQAIAREITERKRAEFELQKSRNFVERIAATTPGVLYVYDLDERRAVFSNREIVTVLGYKPEEIMGPGPSLSNLVHPDDQPMVAAHYEAMRHAEDNEIRRLEYRVRHAGGHWVWLSGRETAFERDASGLVKQVVGISQDITVRKAVQEKLTWQANYDALTGLPNRHHFWTRLQSALRRSSIDHSQNSLCLFDVDNFKEINDRYGHAAGDEVLEEIGNIVRAELRSSDIAGRLGGDEFCFVLPGTDHDEAARVADRMRERLSTLAFGIDSGSPFSVTATFGVAESLPDIDAKDFMEAADRALYRAKSAGRNRVCVDV